MLHFTQRIFVGFLLVLLSACTHYYYRPNPLPMAYIQEKNDAFVGLGLVGDFSQNGLDARVAYSPANHVLLNATYTQIRSDQHGSTTENWAENSLAELGIGYYQRRSEAVFSFLGGYGYGWTKHHFGTQKYAKLQINRVFLQSSAAVSFNNLRVAGGLRLVYLDFTSGSIDVGIGSQSDGRINLDAIRLIEAETPFIFPEIGLETSFSFDPLVLGLSAALSLNNDAIARRFQSTTFGLNLALNINQLFRNKKQ